MLPSGDVEDYADSLQRDGVLIVDGYLDSAECDSIKSRIDEILNQDDVTVVKGGSMSYGELASKEEPVVNERTGEYDDGMLDVFNVDLAVPAVEAIKTDEIIQEVITRAAGEEYTPDNINVYVNRSVTTTRDYHADTYSGKFKSFVYLTDVADESYGPFSYVKGSHESSMAKRKVSQLVNRIRDNPGTDAVFYDKGDVRICTAQKGTLILANQAGYHRGIPQKEGKERMLLTTSYTPK